jgi:hypothetical protein
MEAEYPLNPPKSPLKAALTKATTSKPSSSKLTVTRKSTQGGGSTANKISRLTSSLNVQRHETMEMENDESDNEAVNYLEQLQRERMARAALQRQVDEMREFMEGLRVDIGQIRDTQAEVSNRVEYQGKDLVMDFHGKNLVRYALDVVEHLFTPEEIVDNVLEDSNKTVRGALDHERVKLLKEAVTLKYGLKGEKMDKAWNAIKSAVNQKGRNLKFKISVKCFLTKSFKRNSKNGDGNNGSDGGASGGQSIEAA